MAEKQCFKNKIILFFWYYKYRAQLLAFVAPNDLHLRTDLDVKIRVVLQINQ